MSRRRQSPTHCFLTLGVQRFVGPDRIHCQENSGPRCRIPGPYRCRLKPGVSLVQAEQDAGRVADDFQRDHQDICTGNLRLRVNVDPPGAREAACARPVLMALLEQSSNVLLTACANVTNLPASANGRRSVTCFLVGETDLLHPAREDRPPLYRVFGPGRCSKLLGDRQRADPIPSGCPLDAGDPRL